MIASLNNIQSTRNSPTSPLSMESPLWCPASTTAMHCKSLTVCVYARSLIFYRKLRLDISAPMRQAALDLIKTNPYSSKSKEQSDFSSLRLLRKPSPPRAYLHRPVTPPIFPRSRTDSHTDTEPQTFSEVTSAIKSVTMSDDDAFSDHLAVVDGCTGHHAPRS